MMADQSQAGIVSAIKKRYGFRARSSVRCGVLSASKACCRVSKRKNPEHQTPNPETLNLNPKKPNPETLNPESPKPSVQSLSFWAGVGGLRSLGFRGLA